MKKFYKSKTFWLNAISVLISILSLTTPVLDAFIYDIEMKFKVISIFGFISGFLNIILRLYFTTKPIGNEEF